MEYVHLREKSSSLPAQDGSWQLCESGLGVLSCRLRVIENNGQKKKHICCIHGGHPQNILPPFQPTLVNKSLSLKPTLVDLRIDRIDHNLGMAKSGEMNMANPIFYPSWKMTFAGYPCIPLKGKELPVVVPNKWGTGCVPCNSGGLPIYSGTTWSPCSRRLKCLVTQHEAFKQYV